MPIKMYERHVDITVVSYLWLVVTAEVKRHGDAGPEVADERGEEAGVALDEARQEGVPQRRHQRLVLLVAEVQRQLAVDRCCTGKNMEFFFVLVKIHNVCLHATLV